jgi:type VI secretion system protein ImpA
MSARWEGEESLLQPITADQPCGESLEDTELLASFDTYQLFGQSRPLDAPAAPDEKRIPKPLSSPEWGEIRDKARDALAKSKDLRLLAFLGTALIRTNGVSGFSATLNVAAEWLSTHWAQTYPLVEGSDAIYRRNVLSNFADSMAVVDGLRRVPLVSSRRYGTFSLRDIDVATHQLQPAKDETVADENHIAAAFGSMPIAELTQLHENVTSAVASLHKIDDTMRESGGAEAAPNFELLSAQLARMSQVLRAQLASHPERAADAAPGVDTGAASGGAADGPALSGVVRSRQDAIRALDAVAAYFRQTEPSSPIPMFLERAKRLVSKDFLEVLADIAPGALDEARLAGGLKKEAE